jgi:Ni,Fe-hydrogenase I cytochrome b subunit
MSTRFRFQALWAGLLPLLVTLMTWLLARSLNMPESLVHATYVFVFAQIRTVETSVGKSLCSTTLMRQLLARYRR